MFAAAASMQTLSPPFPRNDAKQLIDNERVTVWDATWPKGKAIPAYRTVDDMVTVELSDAAYQSDKNTVSVKLGQAAFIKSGTSGLETGTSDTPRHVIAIDLKNARVAPMENKSGYPDAFPREGIKKVLDNDRVTIWDYSWTFGKPTPMHFHAKDVVTIYVSTGEIRSTALDGTVTVNSVTPGLARFNLRNRTHTEELIKGAGRAIIVELK
jgi:hypothetical protein